MSSNTAPVTAGSTLTRQFMKVRTSKCARTQAYGETDAGIPTDQKKPATGGAAPPTLPPDTTGQIEEEKEELVQITVGKKKLWYCRQCGYVVFREDPPYICPICKAKREMFAEIKASLNLSG